jgi:hypothetical protein
MCFEDPNDVPFTLVCIHCDAGDLLHSEQQALAYGWTDLEIAPDLPMANWLGFCPDCRSEEIERMASRGLA